MRGRDALALVAVRECSKREAPRQRGGVVDETGRYGALRNPKNLRFDSKRTRDVKRAFEKTQNRKFTLFAINSSFAAAMFAGATLARSPRGTFVWGRKSSAGMAGHKS